MRDSIVKIVQSWGTDESPVNSTESILKWIEEMNKRFVVSVEKAYLTKGDYWYYESNTGNIVNNNRSFFSICGVKYYREDQLIIEQPIINQNEIGFLGIICSEIDGILHFLMQAKVEPGNVNSVQISPTIQATKSNFSQAHGGRVPHYFSYFKNASKYDIVFDQIQSEQNSRFYKKRNRNIMIYVDEQIPLLPMYKWMTLGQIKKLMRFDNLINMDTRTVISGIPFSTYTFSESTKNYLRQYISEECLFCSIWESDIQNGLDKLFNYQNDIKMFNNIRSELVPLNSIKTWEREEQGVYCRNDANFEVGYYHVEISEREVASWKQPLIAPRGQAIFALLFSEHDGAYQYLVKVKSEVGTFDIVEIGPTVQSDNIDKEKEDDVLRLFQYQLKSGKGVLIDNLFSEEGGRFFHEQNRNIIMKIDYISQEQLPAGYFWISYSTLNSLIQINNCLNIQLRNLLSIIN